MNEATKNFIEECEKEMQPLRTAVENPDQAHITEYLKGVIEKMSYETDPTRSLFDGTYRLLSESGMSDKNVVNALNIVDQEFADRIAEF